jgi:hypothetical protein
MVVGRKRLNSLYFETWRRLSKHGVTYMKIYIHIPKKKKKTMLEPFEKKGTFGGY